ncbi:dysbindin domain-containing protein 1-like isoform X1 [Acipenser oxyrinchus oxyrinchus]|uniref:Dysbindin domain-containing protein 1 n=1 Tax=Acipenser oxyrinchus oxyrinchus TaxID=40147 RepID=A0AAD8G4B8_ACIOX|nr:dysbindin domain-containing protein 1-like isoform X1 [Acipenser oxyrinchus oxyrinchus]
MEAQGGAGTPELNKEALNPLKASASGDLKTDVSHNPLGEEEGGIPFLNSGLLQVAERRQPLSSVSSLEVHFDLQDLTELTDMSDQELAEVFADSDEETQNESPATLHQPPLPRGGYLRSPSWTKTKAEHRRNRKSNPSESEQLLDADRPKKP